MQRPHNDGTGTAPPALDSAMREAIADAGGNPSSPTAEQGLQAGEKLLQRVLATDCDRREAALDLLTVDALLTQALEVANSGDDDGDRFVELMLQRIAALEP